MNIVEFLDKVKPVSGYRITGQFIDFYFKDEIATYIKDDNGKIETDPFYYNTLIAPIHHKYLPSVIRKAAETAKHMPYIRKGWIHTIVTPADLSTAEFNDLSDYIVYGHSFGKDIAGDYIELCQASNFVFDIICNLDGYIHCIHAIGYDSDGYTDVLFSFDLDLFWALGDDAIQQVQGYFKIFQDDTKFNIFPLLDKVFRDYVCKDLSAANRAVPNQN